MAELQREEVDRGLFADPVGQLRDLHAPPALLVGAHALPVGVAVDHQRVLARREALLAEGHEATDVLGIGRVDFRVALVQAGEELAPVELFRLALAQPEEPSTGEVGAQRRRVVRVAAVPVEEQHQLHPRVVVERDPDAIEELQDGAIGVVVGGAVDHQGPGALSLLDAASIRGARQAGEEKCGQNGRKVGLHVHGVDQKRSVTRRSELPNVIGRRSTSSPWR